MPRLNVGELLPDLTVDTVQKRHMKLSEIVGGKRTIFMVLRYIGCTVCRYDVHLLAQRYGEFQALGAQVVVVMQSPIATVEKDLVENIPPFYLICDPEQVIYKTLTISPAVSMEELIGDSLSSLQEKGVQASAAGFAHGDYEGIEEQLPAFFLVNGEMIAEEVHYAKHIMDMPSVDEMLEKITAYVRKPFFEK